MKPSRKRLALLLPFLALPFLADPASLRAENTITMGIGSGEPGDTNIRVLVTASNDTAISGYSLAFAFPAEALELTDISLVGTHINALEPRLCGGPHRQPARPRLDGGDLSNVGRHRYPRGATCLAARILPEDRGATDVQGKAGRALWGFSSGAQERYRPSPRRFNHFTNRGTTIKPTLVDGSFVVEGGNKLTLEKKFSFAGTNGLTLFAYAQHPDPLAGFSIAFVFEKGALTMDPIDGGTYNGTDLGFELGAPADRGVPVRSGHELQRHSVPSLGAGPLRQRASDRRPDALPIARAPGPEPHPVYVQRQPLRRRRQAVPGPHAAQLR